MSKRVSPCERLHVQIDDVFAEGGDLAGAIERVARLGAQLLLQAAIEGEVAAFLGRERYERAANCENARAGMRNGHCPTTIKTTAGPVTVQRPKLRGTTERFASQLFGTGVTKSNALEALVIAGFVRGLSTPRYRSHPGGGPGRGGRGVALDGVAGPRADQDRSSTPGAYAVLRRLSWTTCSRTGRTSSTTPTPAPSRCWPRGASTPPPSQCSSAWKRPLRSPGMPGKGS